MPQFIRLDMFPATVVAGGETYTPCRAIVTDDAVHVYMDASGGPQEVFYARMDDISGRRTTGYTIEADDKAITINPAAGCGCGSRLRGFRPFAGVPMQAMA